MSPPVCVRPHCDRSEGIESVVLPDGRMHALCGKCVQEFVKDDTIDKAIDSKMQATRRFDVRLRALAGPRADVEECDRAGDELTRRTSILSEIVKTWLERGPGPGRFS